MSRHAPGIRIDIARTLFDAAVVQAELGEARDRLREEEVEGTAGGGVVRVRLGGDLMLREVVIDPSVFAEPDPEVAGELIRAAVNDSLRAIQERAASVLGGVTAGGGPGGRSGGG